ncbi:PPA1309 family protein [Nocardioides sp.]|uniref:PPA1309 family protein n=1 Tax=Nocardioides sp. TaxID=35761 RepID=UPI002D110943|nr:PPA1309 family protein [Nocardioides sp.]HSX66068.1 PPA1309 family protein [Nocardioides sp.]
MTQPSDQPTPEGAFDRALAEAVVEIEDHAAEAGWDGQARLFALVDTQALAAAEPALAEALGLDAAAEGLTPVEQDLEPGQQLEQVLEQIGWPEEVAGCAVVVERLVLPPAVEGEVPEGLEEARAFAADHPDRQEVRIVAGVNRAGASWCTLRLREHDRTEDVIGGVDLVPALLALLHGTLEDEA